MNARWFITIFFKSGLLVDLTNHKAGEAQVIDFYLNTLLCVLIIREMH